MARIHASGIYGIEFDDKSLFLDFSPRIETTVKFLRSQITQSRFINPVLKERLLKTKITKIFIVDRCSSAKADLTLPKFAENFRLLGYKILEKEKDVRTKLSRNESIRAIGLRTTAKPVLDIRTGKVYQSCAAFDRALGLRSQATSRAMLLLGEQLVMRITYDEYCELRGNDTNQTTGEMPVEGLPANSK